MKKHLEILLTLFGLLLVPAVHAGGVYQKPADFIRQVFDNTPPRAEVLWLNADLKKQLAGVLQHKYRGMRVRYWRQGDRTAWVLEEIGKEKPITAGIVVNQGRIEQVRILVFRESRGWEVRHDFFTDQFKQAQLTKNLALSSSVDNISGATLSVRAVKKLARVALLLDRQVQQKKRKPE